MSWVNPKTDWRSNDYFNVGDWERIVNNIQYLANAYPNYELQSPNLANINLDRDALSLPYVSLINKLEQNLTLLYDILNEPDEVQWQKVIWYNRLDSNYVRNPDYTDWIRWEKLLLDIYNVISKFVKMSYISNEFISGEV